MFLESIEAHHFRNLSGKIDLGRKLNIIYGSNGQGKTSWLEAIHLLSRIKSFRTQRLQEAIRFGEQTAGVRGIVVSGHDLTREVQVVLEQNSKICSINGKRESSARYLSQLHVFSFTADELEVVRGVSEARRRFIDRGIFSLRPGYIKTVSDYNRVIKQKNQILQDSLTGQLSKVETEDLLTPWNEKLVVLAAEIIRQRVEYIDRINQVLELGLFEDRGIIIRYVSSLEANDEKCDYEALLRDRLRQRLPAELALGRSLIGPHRDNLEILMDGREMRVFGSSGQQRSALLLLDLGAISLYNLENGEYPLFLIDDVDAELDEERVDRLLNYLENRTQTFITTSKKGCVEKYISRASVYEISGGRAMMKVPERASAAHSLGIKVS